MQSLKFKALVATCVAIASGALSQSAVAHTTVQVQATEGTTTYNNLVIGHGCTLADGSKLPVIAQSVVFPTVNPKLTVTGTLTGTMDNVLSVTTFANLPQLIQNNSIFTKQSEKTNATGNVIGFSSTEGSLDPNLHGLIPFRTGGVSFGTGSCITKLVVQIAVADICQKNGAKNLWIPAVTTKFSDPAIDGIGSPASLTINRDTSKNPLPANCGTGYSVTLTPSAEDVDANLPIPGYL
jgi:hypothetical protein